MLLVDTSVWIDYFRHGGFELEDHLSSEHVLMHPYVRAELACGTLKDRSKILRKLRGLSPAPLARDADVLHLIEEKHLWGRGLGWVDMHLLASALLSDCRLWTLDKRLERAASDLGI